ncbi:MAG: hypothetical protein MUF38_11770 [Anaerolineae bacterium]|jgi:hypothetical protein|nr:hypothetical protein [Anaerolineae bacterium]
MRRITVLVLLLLTVALTAACSAIPPTGDTDDQALSAQNQMPPAPDGYQTIQADSIQSAMTAAATAANLSTVNLLGAALVNRIDALATCYRDVGALDARAYVSLRDAGGGIAIVINNNRITDNLIQCVNEAAGARFRSQDAFQPCVSNGTFTASDNGLTNTFTYIYAGSTPALCTAFQNHFANR